MLQCVIIGCGNIAGGYDNPVDDKIRTHAKAFTLDSNCELVGVCDSNIEIVQRFAKTWKTPFVTTDPAELLKECEPDIVSICSPTDTHEDIFNLACAENVPNIWLEKPAAQSLAAVYRMKALADSSSTKVWVNYFRRYDHGFRLVKSKLPELGKVRHVQALYTKGIRHNGSHILDLIIWLFGNINNFSVTNVLDDPQFVSVSGKLSCGELDIDLVALDYNAYEMFELDVLADKGRIRIVEGGQKIIFENVIKDKYYKGYRNLDVENIHTGTYDKFMAEGLSLALGGAAMPGLDDEIAIQEVLDTIQV